MKAMFRTLAVALTLASLGIGAAYAQATTGGGANNPAQRGPRDSFFYGPLNGGKPQDGVLNNSLGNSLIKRPPKGNGAVTPVPEPSQWAMMLAGLALVGFIVKRRKDAR
jgi:hypothetical protein